VAIGHTPPRGRASRSSSRRFRRSGQRGCATSGSRRRAAARARSGSGFALSWPEPPHRS
jgi:hypothetical protein